MNLFFVLFIYESWNEGVRIELDSCLIGKPHPLPVYFSFALLCNQKMKQLLKYWVFFRKKEPNILDRTVKCCLLNGAVFWSSIFVFENVILPAVQMTVFILSAGTYIQGVH